MSVNPADSEIFGSLYGTAEMHELFSDAASLQFMLDIEAALARAEAKTGLVPESVADSITAAARAENLNRARIAESTRNIGYPVVGVVNELRRLAGEEAARYIHLGATTQDILDTAMVMQMRRGLDYVRRDVLAVARALADRAIQYRETPMAGRTHLQHAVPIAFGFKCAGWADPLAAHLERLEQASRRMLVVQFGGAAGTLASLGALGPAIAQALADELGLGMPDIPWHTARDRFAEVTGVLALICGTLSKFAFDITLLMQTEIAEVSEPHEEHRGGSSTMPQKRNPIASEYIIACARGVHALAPAMYSAMTQDHERATGSWQSERLVLPQCFVLAAGALAHARSIAEGMIVDTERMRRNLDAAGGLIMAEAIAAELTPALGRAAAHDAVARACDQALAEARPLSEILRASDAIRAHLSDEAIERLADPASYMGASGAFVDRVVARIRALA